MYGSEKKSHLSAFSALHDWHTGYAWHIVKTKFVTINSIICHACREELVME